MQKKLIALAVAGLVAAPVAMAQSNVTIYGVADIGVVHQSNHTTSGVGNRTGLDSSSAFNRNGSRLGFRGTEDLGNGLKVGFVYEMGLDLSTGTTASGGTFGRQAFATLGGNFGTIAMGRQYSPQFNVVTGFDPFAQGMAGNAGQLYVNNARLDNLLAYVSPNFGGFNVVLGYTVNGIGNEVEKDTGNVRVFAINPNYSNGPIKVSLNYHELESDIDGAEKQKVWDLGGSYDFGVAKIAALYGTRENDASGLAADAVSEDETDTRNWMLGATIPVSDAGNFLVSYNHRKNKDSGDKAKAWAVGYDHMLSKRTNLYTSIAKRSGDDFTGYENVYQVGLRHAF